MLFLRKTLAVLALLCCAPMAHADTVRVEHGGDTFLSGQMINETLSAPRDAFATARTVLVGGETVGDLHVTGFDVTVTGNTAQDLYAVGGSIVLRGDVDEDLSAAGFSVRIEPGAETRGNARLAGRTLKIEGPITGALSAVGQDILLNAPVQGDVRLLAQSISFGPEAVVMGTLTYGSHEEIDVPTRVAHADRVVFRQVTAMESWKEWEDIRKEMPVLPTAGSILFGFVVTLLFFVVLGAVVLGFMPKRLEMMRSTILQVPGQSLLLGVIGLSILFGLVPVAALTIVGLPFVLIVLLVIAVVWTLGYALGAYSVATRLYTAFGGDETPSNTARLVVFAAAITVVALLNFIPFVGWVANYTLVLLGTGAMTHALFRRIIGNPRGAFDIKEDSQPLEEKTE